MSDSTQAYLAAVVKGSLDEVENGPQPQGFFTEYGYRQSLAGVEAASALQPRGGSSIAQHVKHAAFSARASAGFLRGEQLSPDWDSSWQVAALDEAAWQALQEDLYAALAELREAVAAHANGSEQSASEAIGAAAHQAYHLGAIRQKLLL